MGCDIHFYVERRNASGVWETADKWSPNEYYDPDQPEDGEPELSLEYDDRYYSGRNYDLFAILADVRNGRGFAGVKTGEGFNPIAPPRGVPEDCCPEYAAEVERWNGDGHSHSYFTLAELLAYDWTQVTGHGGWVNPTEWARWRDRGKPDGWSGGVGGGGVRQLTPVDFEAAWQNLRDERGYPLERHASAHLRILSGGSNPDLERFVDLLGGGSPYTYVTWKEPYYVSAGSVFLGQTLPRLLGLSDGDHDSVRICFFFDN